MGLFNGVEGNQDTHSIPQILLNGPEGTRFKTLLLKSMGKEKSSDGRDEERAARFQVPSDEGYCVE